MWTGIGPRPKSMNASVSPDRLGQRTHVGAVLLDELRERLGACRSCLIPRDSQGGGRGREGRRDDAVNGHGSHPVSFPSRRETRSRPLQ
jgi:hypothetical protein